MEVFAFLATVDTVGGGSFAQFMCCDAVVSADSDVKISDRELGRKSSLVYRLMLR